MNGIGLCTYTEEELGAPCRSECLRYLRAPHADARTEALLDSCIAELEGRLTARVCYRIVGLSSEEGAFLSASGSSALAKQLSGCTHALVFAATIGLEPDRLIAKYGTLAPSRALCFQAIGSERIEALCELFCSLWERRGMRLRPRFSPGYADLPLQLQTPIFRLLDCPRQIGLYLCESLLMTPSKSVTAIVGIEAGELEKNDENT